MTTDFPTASVGSSQAPTAAVEKSQSASNTEIQTLPAELTVRIARSVEFVRSVPPERIDGTEDDEIVLPVTGKETRYKGMQLLLGHSMPNVYFHATTAYNILRQIGVPIGKRDFLGNP